MISGRVQKPYPHPPYGKFGPYLEVRKYYSSPTLHDIVVIAFNDLMASVVRRCLDDGGRRLALWLGFGAVFRAHFLRCVCVLKRSSWPPKRSSEPSGERDRVGGPFHCLPDRLSTSHTFSVLTEWRQTSLKHSGGRRRDIK